MVPFAVLPKYTAPSWLEVRFSACTPVSLIVISVRACARTSGEADANATTANTNRRMVWLRMYSLRGDCRLPAVADTDETIAGVVADQDRSVGQLQRVGRAAAGDAHRPASAKCGCRTGQEAVQERFIARHSTSIRERRHDAITARRRAVPRPVLGDDCRVLVARRKHVAGIEREANRRHVRAKLLYRRLGRGAGALCAELGIRDVSLVAEREPEVQARLV